MPKPKPDQQAGEAWRDHLLMEVVTFLNDNRSAIIERFEHGHPAGLSQQQLEEEGLLDFDVAITLHRDRDSDFGLGSGFFKANLIR